MLRVWCKESKRISFFARFDIQCTRSDWAVTTASGDACQDGECEQVASLVLTLVSVVDKRYQSS